MSLAFAEQDMVRNTYAVRQMLQAVKARHTYAEITDAVQRQGVTPYGHKSFWRITDSGQDTIRADYLSALCNAFGISPMGSLQVVRGIERVPASQFRKLGQEYCCLGGSVQAFARQFTEEHPAIRLGIASITAQFSDSNSYRRTVYNKLYHALLYAVNEFRTKRAAHASCRPMRYTSARRYGKAIDALVRQWSCSRKDVARAVAIEAGLSASYVYDRSHSPNRKYAYTAKVLMRAFEAAQRLRMRYPAEPPPIPTAAPPAHRNAVPLHIKRLRRDFLR